MPDLMVNIDFDIMAKALRDHVREKAARANTSIVYLKNGSVIQEDLKNHQYKTFTPGTSNRD